MSVTVVTALLMLVIGASFSLGYCVAYAARDDERYRQDDHVP